MAKKTRRVKKRKSGKKRVGKITHHKPAPLRNATKMSLEALTLQAANIFPKKRWYRVFWKNGDHTRLIIAVAFLVEENGNNRDRYVELYETVPAYIGKVSQWKEIEKLNRCILSGFDFLYTNGTIYFADSGKRIFAKNIETGVERRLGQIHDGHIIGMSLPDTKDMLFITVEHGYRVNTIEKHERIKI